MAAAVFFSAVSCAKEDVSSSLAGGEVEVTFTANLADLGTRAYGDGKTVDEVYLGIYSKGELLEGLTSKDGKMIAYPVNGEGKASITVVLLKDKVYDLVFWAQNSEAGCYSMNWTERKLYVNYNDVLSQAEDRDAFFHVDNNFKAGETKNPEFTLKRPFAQLRAAISEADYGFIQQNEVNIVESKVVVSDVASTLNLNSENATVEDNTSVTFDYAAIPDGVDTKIQVAGKEYYQLSMNYLLVDTKRLVQVEYTFKDDQDTTYERPYHQVPVQRNYRTNIVGQLISSEYEFEVTIDPIFNKDELGNLLPDYTYVTTIEEMQAVLDAAAQKGKDLHVVLGADLVGDVTVLQAEGANITIDGLTKEDGIIHSFDGTITINGDARANGEETLTITNIKFATESEKTFIDAPTNINGKYNYSHNVTVDNCTFSAASYNEGVVGIKLLTTYNAVVKNCSASNMHSLAQFQSTDNATVIENVKVADCKNGISLGNMASATISGSVIYAKGYGVRLDGAKEREVAVTISGSSINAYIPVNVRKMNNDACKATVKFEGENSLTGDSYEIAFCSNEYEEGVAPEAPKGTFTLDGAKGFDAYVGPINSVSALDAAINSNGDVTVEAAINNVGLGFEVERDVVLDFANYELNAGSDANSTWYAIQADGDYDVTIQNANFTRAGVLANHGADVVFENGVINHKPERSSRYIFCAWNGSTITIKGGTFKNDRANNSYFWADNATIVVEGGNFGGVASNKKVVLTNNGKLIIKGGTFNFDPTAYVPAGYAVTKDGSTWKVELDDLNAALTEGATVTLSKNVNYGTITAGVLKNVTIIGAEGSSLIFKTDANSVLENVTLKEVNFVYNGDTTDFGVVINAEAQIENLVVEGCSFSGIGTKAGRGIYGQNPNATIVLKNCNFRDMGYPVYTMSAGGYKSLVVEGCTFELIKSWAIMPQYNDYLGDLTVTGCTFTNCTGGLVKAGAFTAGHTFTFTNNTVNNSSEHSAKNWFTINTAAASKVVEGNTKDGAAWTPGDAEGLK